VKKLVKFYSVCTVHHIEHFFVINIKIFILILITLKQIFKHANSGNFCNNLSILQCEHMVDYKITFTSFFIQIIFLVINHTFDYVHSKLVNLSFHGFFLFGYTINRIIQPILGINVTSVTR